MNKKCKEIQPTKRNSLLVNHLNENVLDKEHRLLLLCKSMKVNKGSTSTKESVS